MRTSFYTLETKGKLLAKMQEGNQDAMNVVINEIDRLESRVKDLELGIDLAHGKKEKISRAADINFEL
jgi:GTP1/Obg family GTP-binding protein